MSDPSDAVTVSVDDVTIVLGLFALLLDGQADDDPLVAISERVSARLRHALSQLAPPP